MTEECEHCLEEDIEPCPECGLCELCCECDAAESDFDSEDDDAQ